jgi:hypothetical protein
VSSCEVRGKRHGAVVRDVEQRCSQWLVTDEMVGRSGGAEHVHAM